jgi:hypothetical protein
MTHKTHPIGTAESYRRLAALAAELEKVVEGDKTKADFAEQVKRFLALAEDAEAKEAEAERRRTI